MTRYEIDHNGVIVEHDSALCSNMDQMLIDLFSCNGWSCEIADKEASCRKLELKHTSGNTKTINVFAGTIRNEARSPYEKKMQLGSSADPRTKQKESTIILGIYVYEANDSVNDAIFVGYPIDNTIRYDTNPSLRGVFVDKLLFEAKSKGMVYDSEHNTVAFKSNFVYYYLDNHYDFHYKNQIIPAVDDNPIFSPEWFNEKGKEFIDLDAEANQLYDEFSSKFSPTILKSLSKEELLNTVFLNQTNPDNMCHELEFNPRIKLLMGSISGGFSYNYGLFYSPKDSSWKSGSSRNNENLNVAEACTVGETIRDYLVAGAELIETSALETVEQYRELFPKLYTITGGYINRSWVMKYYHMIYPKKIAPFYSEKTHEKVFQVLNFDPENSPFARIGKIQEFINKCEISDAVFGRVFYSYCLGVDVGESEMDNGKVSINYHTNYDTSFKRNRIIFGAPGTGKSFILNQDRKELMFGERDFNEDGVDITQYGGYERVTFHPDYAYANFVGTYKPVPKENNDGITYEFVPGPFLRVYVDALKNSATGDVKPYVLVIEEINRANVAAVFGDVFQLLDRNSDNISEYPIQISEDMKRYLSRSDVLGGLPEDYTYIKLPDNMFIWATMNSADQGVFFMDTAFKRRWDFTYIGVNKSQTDLPNSTEYTFGNPKLKSQKATWNAVRVSINNRLSKLKINEDKLMGPFFLSKATLEANEAEFHEAFKNKVLMYLFEDAAKQRHKDLFRGDGSQLYSEICADYDCYGLFIFCDEIYSAFGGNEQ